ncbi:MAG: hypothetical protein PF517_17030 [Salinivirgaceae bacterium]|jgi:hypothetical protein|nr:hypothetical protein [Salinivirgaceae bacterium]
MLRSFSTIYTFIIQATVAGFGLVFTGLCMLLVYLFFDNVLWYIPFFIAGILISILVGSYLSVVLSIPFKLPQQFDKLKNKVALGHYSNLQAFQEDIADFMLTFFNFIGADIEGGKFHFTDCKATIKPCNVDFDALTETSFRNNKAKINGNYKAFHVPIHLGSEKLGYIIIITKGYTIPIFYAILQDFENYYLDDQIKCFVK